MNILAQPLRLTPEQFEALPEQRGLELVDGAVKEKKMGTECGSISSRVTHFLWSIVLPARLGEVIDGDGMYQCFPSHPGRVRKPDVSYIRRERLPAGRVPVGITHIPPDLVAEVVSPNDEYETVDERVADYFDAGVSLIWVIAPRTRTVLVYHSDGSAIRLRETDYLTADPVFPGLRVRVADLFPNPPEPLSAKEPAPQAPSA